MSIRSGSIVILSPCFCVSISIPVRPFSNAATVQGSTNETFASSSCCRRSELMRFTRRAAPRHLWSGSGTVAPTGGQRPMVRCRVSYSPQGSKVVTVSATCTSASTTIHKTGQLSMVTPNRYVGDFYNSEYDISGRIRVSVSGPCADRHVFQSPGQGQSQSQKAVNPATLFVRSGQDQSRRSGGKDLDDALVGQFRRREFQWVEPVHSRRGEVVKASAGLRVRSSIRLTFFEGWLRSIPGPHDFLSIVPPSPTSRTSSQPSVKTMRTDFPSQRQVPCCPPSAVLVALPSGSRRTSKELPSLW